MPEISSKVDEDFIDRLSPFFTILEIYFRYQVKGLYKIKPQRSMIVMNHGIIPYHGFLLAKKIIENLEIYPRGLGADFLFHIPGVREFFLKGGAVQANPRNAEKLLKQNHVVILAPGGIYEALIAKKQLRRIPWERRKGFVRVAIRTKTPIIPTYCQGINSVYLNSYLFLKTRIKILEKTRFSFPLFFGLGFFPFPIKLKHYIGEPIKTTRRRGETHQAQVDRIHAQVMDAMLKLSEKK